MNRKELCRVFATGAKPKGKASALYFEGRVMYSYGAHWPLAVLKDGVAYVNSDKRSVTTSQHTTAVRYALAMEGWQIEDRDRAAMMELARGAQA